MSKNSFKVNKSLVLRPGSEPTDPNPGELYYDETEKKLKQYDEDAATFIDVGSSGGSGQGGINYLEGDNTNFENGTVGDWVEYNDGAVAEPVDGTGGTATNIAFQANAVSDLRGDWLGNLQKTNTSAQGEGISVDFTIDKADQNSNLYVSWDQKITGDYVTDDLVPFIYDVDNSELVQLSKSGDNTRFTGRFSTNATSINYRLILHVASTSTLEWEVNIDNVQVGPDQIIDFRSDGPVGEVIAFAADSIPDGFLECNGGSKSTTSYPELFSVIGYTWGGSGSAFNLPSLQDDFLRGDGTGSVGDAQGDSTAVNGLATSGAGAHGHTVRVYGGGGAGNQVAIQFAAGGAVDIGGAALGVGDHTHGLTGDFETRPRNKVIKWCIRYKSERGGVLSTTEMLNEASSIRAYRGSTQTVSSTGTTSVVFDTENFNYGGAFSLNSGTGEITVNKKCRVLASAGWRFANHLGETNIMGIQVNGASVIVGAHVVANGTDYNLQDILDLEKGDVVSTRVDSSADASYDLVGASTVTYIALTELPDLTVYSVYPEPLKTQTKYLSSSFTSGTTMSDLTFSNLTIGQWYEIDAQFILSVNTGASDNFVDVIPKHNGSTIARAVLLINNGTSTQDAITVGITKKFKAEATTLTFDATSTSTESFVEGSGAANSTYVTLSEIQPMQETNEW